MESSSDSDADFFDAHESVLESPRAPKKSLVADGIEDTATEPRVIQPDIQSLPAIQISDIEVDVPDAVATLSSLPAIVVNGSATNETLGNEAPSECKTDTKLTLGQQPDIIVCVQERPTNLPGIRQVNVDVPNGSEVASAKKAEDDDKPAVKMKVPPPRPPPPPNRTLMQKRYSHKLKPERPPHLSAFDEGLLTPNSTVENLTREFTEALNKASNSELKISDEPDGSDLKLKVEPAETQIQSSSSRPLDNSDSHDGSNITKKLSRQTSVISSAPQKEENTQWEVTKDTVVKINSSNLEILSSVIVRNLDTGETMPLSAAAEQVSQCLNPLALQIMSRTKEFSYAGSPSNSLSAHDKAQGLVGLPPEIEDLSGDDTISIGSGDIEIGNKLSHRKTNSNGKRIKAKSKRLKKMLGKGVSKVKNVAEAQVERAVQKVKQAKGEDTLNVSSDEDSSEMISSSNIKVKVSSSNKGPHKFIHSKVVQDIAVHVGAVWCMKFSHCGRLLATAGQDNVIWVWVLKNYYTYFNEMRNKYTTKEEEIFPSSSHHPLDMLSTSSFKSEENVSQSSKVNSQDSLDIEDDDAPFRQVPFSSYVGHSSDVLDLAWSKNFFILSSSMDKTVRLWHISRKECLCCFQHIDFVTAIAFHPRDDRYFLSGSLDSKLRLWNIPDKKVALWNEVSPNASSAFSSSSASGVLITTVNFCENGKFAVCGTYDGRCIFFDTEHLKYHTQIHVRSSRGRNTKGRKVTGIEPLPSEHKILVTSNDSRVRLYDLRDLSLVCKYKGLTNLSSQIKASFSPDYKYIISGSEDKYVYIWNTNLPQDVTKLSSFRRDRNDAWECIKAHNAVVTCAVFAPQPHLLRPNSSDSKQIPQASKTKGAFESNIFITADFSGVIKIIISE